MRLEHPELFNKSWARIRMCTRIREASQIDRQLHIIQTLRQALKHVEGAPCTLLVECSQRQIFANGPS
jgi:hypothetical protein